MVAHEIAGVIQITCNGSVDGVLWIGDSSDGSTDILYIISCTTTLLLATTRIIAATTGILPEIPPRLLDTISFDFVSFNLNQSNTEGFWENPVVDCSRGRGRSPRSGL